MSEKKLITEINDNVEGQGSSIQNINEKHFPVQGMEPLPTNPCCGQKPKEDKDKPESKR